MKTRTLKIGTRIKPIFNIDSKYLILVGGSSSGKFYAACQKAVFITGSKPYSSALIICDYITYGLNTLKRILNGVDFKINKPFGLIELSNGSKIRISSPSKFDPSGLEFDFIVIQSANCLDDVFANTVIRRINNEGQVLLTANKIGVDSWLNRIFKDSDSSMVDIGDKQFTTIHHG